MQTNSAQVTMDSKELELLERYEAQFGETPPVAFLESSNIQENVSGRAPEQSSIR
jgi:hypothetical protein